MGGKKGHKFELRGFDIVEYRSSSKSTGRGLKFLKNKMVVAMYSGDVGRYNLIYNFLFAN